MPDDRAPLKHGADHGALGPDPIPGVTDAGPVAAVIEFASVRGASSYAFPAEIHTVEFESLQTNSERFTMETSDQGNDNQLLIAGRGFYVWEAGVQDITLSTNRDGHLFIELDLDVEPPYERDDWVSSHGVDASELTDPVTSIWSSHYIADVAGADTDDMKMKVGPFPLHGSFAIFNDNTYVIRMRLLYNESGDEATAKTVEEPYIAVRRIGDPGALL